MKLSFDIVLKIYISAVVMVFVLPTSKAYAISVSAPITASNGSISCPTCVKASSNVTQNAIVYGSDGGRGVAGVTVNSSGTKKYLSQTSSGTPSFDQPAITELSTFSSSDLAGRVTDETGTGALVLGTNPSLGGVTVTGTANLTGATVDLPSGAVNAIGEIDTAIKSGGTNAVKVVTTIATSPTINNCAKWDDNGNLVDAGSGCGGAQLLTLSSSTPIEVSNLTDVYMSLNGDVSTSESDVLTPIISASTFSNLQCFAATAPTVVITATLGTGACNSVSYTAPKAKVVMNTAANTAGTSSLTSSTSANQCAAIKFTAASAAAATNVHCTYERSA